MLHAATKIGPGVKVEVMHKFFSGKNVESICESREMGCAALKVSDMLTLLSIILYTCILEFSITIIKVFVFFNASSINNIALFSSNAS